MRLKQKHIIFLISAALGIVTLIAYEPMRHNDFVNYDDFSYVKNNPNITEGMTLKSVTWAFTKSYSANWHPLTWLTHILDHQLFGVNPSGHHIVSLLFHIFNALLLFWLLSYMTGTFWVSAFVAGVFALHPIQVESVAWAAERKTVVSGLFWLLTMIIYVRYARRPNMLRYILLILIYGLCIMTKPVVVTLPFVLLLLDYWPLERVRWWARSGPVRTKTTGQQKVSAGRLIIEKIPLFILAAVLCVITVVSQHSAGAVATLEITPLERRIANVFLSYTGYIGQLVWPDRLSVFYPLGHASFSDGGVILCTLVFVIITIISIYIGRRRRYAAVGWLWFAGTLVPMIGLVQAGSQAMADRYMYLSMLGLLMIIVWAVKDLVGGHPRWKIFAAALALVILSSLVVLTRAQVRHWRDGLTLFEHALKVTKSNTEAEFGYGNSLAEAGRLDEAVEHLRNAVRLSSGFHKARKCLCKTYIKQGKFNEAVVCFNEFIKRKQDDAEAYEDLGTAYAQMGKYEKAIESWNKAMELKSDNAKVLNNLAWLLATVGDVSSQNAARAVELAERSCELDSNKRPEFMDTLAAAYAAAGRFEDAVKTAMQAIEAAKAGGQEDTSAEIQKRLELYEAGERYHQSQKTENK